MPKFTLLVNPLPPGDEKKVQANHGQWAPGDQLLLIERQLLDPQTQIQVGRLIARLTFMKVLPNNNALVLGNADHHLDMGNHAKAAA